MPPSPLDDRIVVALSRPIRPQELHLHLDTSYLEATVGTVSKSVISSTTVVKIQANNLTYMPSSSGSTRSLTCGCSSASCCTVTTYEKDNQTQAPTLSQVSTSSPNLNSGVGFGGHGSIPLPTASPSETHSAPSLTVGLPRSGVRVILPNELAQKMTHCPMGHPVGPVPVIIDCRPFLDYNKSHITGAVHINCSDKISRRRLQQGKITVLDLISCRQSKESFKGIFSKEIVVYDEGTVDPGRLSPSQPLHVVLESLQREGKDPIVLRGGLSSFKQGHEELCEHSLHLQDGQDAGAAVSLAGALPHSLPSTPDIENAELTTVLPFLYLEEAHQAGKGLLIHCQAGVSRSATIVIAYLMKHTWMTMTDAYKFVKMRRPIISPNLNFMGQLLEFEEDLNNGITPRILTPKLIGVETIV
ncbi:dual specificity protein phosphatase 10 isoform X2 [Electrophorus electricus]|uniref:dual specificity protein phosphatase 10 isoform X2 n=1 Tax=Electrophorus electricus TaxID=8005 RepID=UPI0015D00253|nr:dual specificity protein phosphatase 10 isoform X2 [Electrophorus electricus]